MKNIFMVDDEVDLCFFLKKNLESDGEFKVTTCSDSEEAFEAIKKAMPDLVVLDVLMPGITGPQIAEQLTSDPKTKDIPVIFLTAIATQDETSSRNHVVGGQHMVAKPVEINHLAEVINTVLA